MLPIGAYLRKNDSRKRQNLTDHSIDAIAQQIAALEQELEESNDSSEEEDDDDGLLEDPPVILEEVDGDGSVVRLISSLCADEDMQIQPLPQQLLPAAHCSTRTGVPAL